MVQLVVVRGDITERRCDVMLLKHADGFHGADAAVAAAIGFQGSVRDQSHAFHRGSGTGADQVLFMGVGPLFNFRYEEIRRFASASLDKLRESRVKCRTLCVNAHGAGYGLDEAEAFYSLVGGLMDGIITGRAPDELERIEIVEINPARAERMGRLLRDILADVPANEQKYSDDSAPKFNLDNHNAIKLASFGAESEQKPKLFVAMPFADEHIDVWDVAIQDACQTVGILCERLDFESYVGDILTEIKMRVEASNGVIAVLDGANANVFLEIGYAWGVGKPTVLLVREGEKIPFDVSGQKCLRYRTIGKLRELLKAELKNLREQGFFSS